MLPFAKRVLPREELTVTTSLGDVRVKRVTQPDGNTRWKTEHDDIQRLAAEHDIDYQRAKSSIDADVAVELGR